MLKNVWTWLGAIVVVAACLSLQHTAAQQAPVTAKPSSTASDRILGEWWTENKQGRIRITKDRDGTFRGTTTCCVHENDPDNPAVDINNPNPKLRARSTVGIVIIWKLKYDDGEYVDGYVYNPRDGKTYRIEARVLDHETIKIRGYLGIPLLGQNQIWKRVHVAARGAPVTAAR